MVGGGGSVWEVSGIKHQVSYNPPVLWGGTVEPPFGLLDRWQLEDLHWGALQGKFGGTSIEYLRRL